MGGESKLLDSLEIVGTGDIPLVLTAIVTVSTIIYTFYSIQLWRTTRAAAEISRQAAFSNLWAELNRYLEILRPQNAPETAFLEKFSNLLLEFMISSLMTHAVAKDDPDFEDFRRRVSKLVAENEADVSRVPSIERLVARKNR